MNFFQALWNEARLAPAFQLIIFWVLGLAALAAVACFTLVIHHAYTSLLRRRRGRLVERATIFLAPHIASADRLKTVVAQSLSRYGNWATSIVLREARGRVSPDRGAQLSSALGEMGEVARLTKLASSRQEWRRSKAVRELGQCGGDAARAVLLESVHDRSPTVRRGAREGLLSDRRPESVKAAIQAYLEDQRTGSASKREFYSQLAGAASAELRDLLNAGRLDRDEEILALEAMGDARNADVLPLARERLSAPDPETRATAARVVGKLGDHGSAPALERLLEDEEWYVRAAAAKAFESMAPSPLSQRLLAGLLDDEVWWVRANAAHALAHQGDGGMDALLAAIDGTDAYSRDVALAVLGQTVLTPSSRKRLQDRLGKKGRSAVHAAPLFRMLDCVAEGAQP